MEFHKKVQFYGYLLIIGTVVLVLTTIVAMHFHNQVVLKENLHEIGFLIASQYKATRQFTSEKQDTINYTEDGKLEYKHLPPAVFVRGIAEIFNKETKYKIKQTRLNPRNSVNAPDEFEIKSLKKLANERHLEQITGYTGKGDEKVFRYLFPLNYEESCLECHGDPAGEIDISGYSKEGYQVGEFAGALSISIPVNHFANHYPKNIIGEITIVAIFAGLILPFTLFMLKRVTIISRELQESHLELIKLEAQKEEFTQMIVHDLKNPLSVIKGGISLLNKTTEDPAGIKLVKLVNKNVDRLNLMVSELTETSKMESGEYPIKLSSFSLIDLLNDKKASIDKLGNKKVDWEFHLPADVPSIRSDYLIVDRVIDNIINNAYNLVPENSGRIEVSVNYEPGASLVEVAIKDNGPGVPKQSQQMIFEKFYQINGNKAVRKGDIGLGLAFCRLALSKVGGEIRVESDGENGSIFIFTLPVIDIST